MNPKRTVSLTCEACPICKKHIPVMVEKETLIIGLTGLCTVVDVHGLLLNPPHVRIMHVDQNGDVRAFEICNVISVSKNLPAKVKIEALEEENIQLKEEIMHLKNLVMELQCSNKELRERLKEKDTGPKLIKKDEPEENVLVQRMKPTEFLSQPLSSIFSHAKKVSNENKEK